MNSANPVRRMVCAFATVVMVLGAVSTDASESGSDDATRDADRHADRLLYTTDWQRGGETGLDLQEADVGDITRTADPLSTNKSAMRVQLSRSSDFSHVANGQPRSEMVFGRLFQVMDGHEYRIRWSTYIPSDFPFAQNETVIVMQIHQGTRAGSPPIMLTIAGEEYAFSERGGTVTTHGRGPHLCCASADKEKWVQWTLDYRPDGTGRNARSVLWKDGTEVFDSSGLPNAYPNDDSAYLKLGLYKPGWLTAPSKVHEMKLFYGPVTVSERQR